MGRKKCKSYPEGLLIPLVIKNTALKRIHVPHYQNLRRMELTNIMVEKYPDQEAYFPINKELLKLPRDWLMNMLATLNSVEFPALVKLRMNERHA